MTSPAGPAPQGTDGPAAGRGPARGWWAVGALVAGVAAMWSLSMPLMASPDEPSHVDKAAAVARGQLDGPLGTAPVDDTTTGRPTTVVVPTDLADLAALTCFRAGADESAACQEPLPARTGTAAVATYAGQYPPLYYALVGWPSLVASGSAAVYGMRLVGALLGSALLVLGVRSALGVVGRRRLWIVVAAVTPMCLFMTSTVNPNGLEIAAGFAFWSALVAVARAPSVRRGDVVLAAVAGAVLSNLRTTGLIWVALALAVAAALAAPGRLRELRGSAGARRAGVVLLVAAALALGWLATHRDVVSASNLHPELGGPVTVLGEMLLATEALLVQMIGEFGWLDTPAPFATVLAWTVTIALGVLLALAAPLRRRDAAALAGVALAVLVVPIAVTLPTAVDMGIVWQGRYTLPLAVGVPLVAAALLATVHGTAEAIVARVGIGLLPVLGAGHLAAYYWALHRYTVGADGPLLSLAPEWDPPLGLLPSLVLQAGLLTALTAVAVRAQRRREPGSARTGAGPQAADAGPARPTFSPPVTPTSV